MRSLLCILGFLSACGGQQKAAPARVDYDPELIEACAPDWGDEAPPGLCQKDDAGQWILPSDDPGRNAIFQVLALSENHRGRSVDEAIVQLTTGIVGRSIEPTCGAQMGRWHRALALYRLGLWKESFKDFASVIKEGPNNPYYAVVDDWLEQLKPHLPSGVVETCMVSYVPYASETETAPE